MQIIDPPLATALASMCAAVLMVHAGIAKRQLTWRPRRTSRGTRRRR